MKTELNSLSKTVKTSKRRIGRGHGSGRVKTSGRGTKGQKARGKIKIGFEGGQIPLYKRLPLYRGRGRNKPFNKNALGINLKYLEKIPANTKVNKDALVKYKIITRETAVKNEIKILGDGEITKALIICLPISKSALKKIEKAGGKLEKNV